MIANTGNLLLANVNKALQIGRLNGGAGRVNAIFVLCIAGEDPTIGRYGIANNQLPYTAGLFDCPVPVIAYRVVIAHPTDIGPSIHLTT